MLPPDGCCPGSIAGPAIDLPAVGVHVLEGHARALLRPSNVKVHRFGIGEQVNEGRLRARVIEVGEEDEFWSFSASSRAVTSWASRFRSPSLPGLIVK